MPDNFSIDEGGRIALHYNEHSSFTPAESKMELASPKVEVDWAALNELDDFESFACDNLTQAQLNQYKNDRAQYQEDYALGPHAVPHNNPNPAAPVFEEWIFAEDDNILVAIDVDTDSHNGNYAKFLAPPSYGVTFPSPVVLNFDEQSTDSMQLPFHMSQLNLDGAGVSSEAANTDVNTAGAQAGESVAGVGPTSAGHSPETATANFEHTGGLSNTAVASSELAQPTTRAEIIASYRPMVLSNVSIDLPLRFWTAQELTEA